MLPYTTYHIPEPENHETQNNEKWLWMIIPGPLSDENNDLLLKISAAVKADFAKDVFCFHLAPGEKSSIASLGKNCSKLIISFGIAPGDLGFWLDLNRPGMLTMESFTFILTLPPDQLAKHPGAKKELWTSMQIFLETM